MSKPQVARYGLLFFAFFSGEQNYLTLFMRAIRKKFGKITLASDIYDCSVFTPYYNTEMGSPLFKQFALVETPLSQEVLYKIKLWAVKFEMRNMKNGARCINIDPGFLLPENYLLLTCKPYSHRVYLRKGVYADLHALYDRARKEYQPLPWSYQDYQTTLARNFFLQARMLLAVKG